MSPRSVEGTSRASSSGAAVIVHPVPSFTARPSSIQALTVFLRKSGLPPVRAASVAASPSGRPAPGMRASR